MPRLFRTLPLFACCLFPFVPPIPAIAASETVMPPPTAAFGPAAASLVPVEPARHGPPDAAGLDRWLGRLDRFATHLVLDPGRVLRTMGFLTFGAALFFGARTWRRRLGRAYAPVSFFFAALACLSAFAFFGAIDPVSFAAALFVFVMAASGIAFAVCAAMWSRVSVPSADGSEAALGRVVERFGHLGFALFLRLGILAGACVLFGDGLIWHGVALLARHPAGALALAAEGVFILGAYVFMAALACQAFARTALAPGRGVRIAFAVSFLSAFGMVAAIATGPFFLDALGSLLPERYFSVPASGPVYPSAALAFVRGFFELGFPMFFLCLLYAVYVTRRFRAAVEK